MTFRTTCSWCHRPNTIDTTPTYCPACGHRADVCRLECDCPRCGPMDLQRSAILLAAPGQPIEEEYLDLDELERALAEPDAPEPHQDDAED
jgi:hypothetical protein